MVDIIITVYMGNLIYIVGVEKQIKYTGQITYCLDPCAPYYLSF